MIRPSGDEHLADLVETERHRRGDQRVDPTGHRHVAFTVAQRLHRLVGGDQRARAGGVDRDRRAVEVEEVRNPVGDNRTRGPGDRVRVGDGRVGHRQVAVVDDGGADEDADGLTAQAGRRDAGVLERLPGQLQRHPLLRVDVVGFGLRQREELGVEALDVGQVAAAGAGLVDPLGQPRLLHELRPAALGQVGDRVATLQQRLPGLLGGVHVAGQPGGQAHHGDVDALDRPAARPVGVVVVGGRLRGRPRRSRWPAIRWSDARRRPRSTP